MVATYQLSNQHLSNVVRYNHLPFSSFLSTCSHARFHAAHLHLSPCYYFVHSSLSNSFRNLHLELFSGGPDPPPPRGYKHGHGRPEVRRSSQGRLGVWSPAASGMVRRAALQLRHGAMGADLELGPSQRSLAEESSLSLAAICPACLSTSVRASRSRAGFLDRIYKQQIGQRQGGRDE
jgi:hypothetical protein